MKTLLTLICYLIMSTTPQKNDLLSLLKTHLQNKKVDQAILLINNHPEILSLKDESGSSGLMLVVYSGAERVLQRAIELKPMLSFHEAIACGKTELVKEYLSEADAQLANTHSADGFTPLSLAAFFDQTEIAKYLLQIGADPSLSATNPSRVNALHSAIAKENYVLCQLLIEKGVNVNAVQAQNVTALHSAVHRGNLKLTELLVENGASVKIKMDNGNTALMIAQQEGHQEIAAYLMTQKQ